MFMDTTRTRAVTFYKGKFGLGSEEGRIGRIIGGKGG